MQTHEFDKDALIARIAELEAQNATLRDDDVDTLPTFYDYDRKVLMTAEDATEALKLGTVRKLSIADVRSVIRLFGLEPSAQFKIAGNRGRGSHLYIRHELETALRRIDSSSL